jgi:hypothetical protein
MTHPFFELLNELDAARVHYTVARHLPDSVMVTATFVGERVEAIVFSDGQVWVSRFKGSESVEGGAEVMRQLIREKGAER